MNVLIPVAEFLGNLRAAPGEFAGWERKMALAIAELQYVCFLVQTSVAVVSRRIPEMRAM